MAASLLWQALSHYNWNGVIAAIECRSDSTDAVYNDYTDIVKWHLNATIPICNVSMSERDPSYVTPRIKLLLRKRKKLRRAGKIEHACCISVKINRLIAKNRSTALAGASNADTKQLWAILKKTGNGSAQKQTVTNLDPDQVNDYFVGIATDSNYNWKCYPGSSAVPKPTG